MDLKLELSDREYDGIKELIRLCNLEDGTNYDTEVEADFYYILENTDEEESGVGESVLSVLFGYRIGEKDEGFPVLELEGFTHPKCRELGLFKSLFYALRDDFRIYRYHFLVKTKRDGVSIEKRSLADSTRGFLSAWDLESIGDELFMKKKLEKGIANPRDTLCNRYGEVYFSPYNEDTLYLYGLLVYKRYQGKGYGRAIMEQIEKQEEGPYQSIILEVNSRNIVAFSLYEKLNFKVIDRSCIYRFS